VPERAISPPTPADLRAAEAVVRERLRPTPLVPAPVLGPDVWLKVETLQPTGSFKVRGALAALARARPDDHVVAVSAGNHGLGVAQAAELLGRSATVVVPVGGGGLVSGIGLWAAEHDDVRVVGVEATTSLALSAAVRAGRVVDVPIGETLADGMKGGIEPGSVSVALAARHVDEWVAVEEREIRAAMRALAFGAGIVTEGSGAAAAGAILAGRVRDERPGARLVAIASGRNITRDLLLEVLAESDPVA